MNLKTLDHVALWVADRDAIAGFLVEKLGMHVIERTDTFTLVGADARRGKLTLFAADGPRETGALAHVAFRVGDLARFEPGLRDEPFEIAEGLRVELVEAATDAELDLDHVALYSADPGGTAEAYRTFGFRPAEPGSDAVPRVEVGGSYVEFHAGAPGDPERPLLNHLAVLVDSAEEHRAAAEELGLEVADFVDAANTRAVFIWGPERVKIELVEHKPSFSLV
jgi:catechol 2,3-dioxygenase-like lactoylglutathione lyase family enzyme